MRDRNDNTISRRHAPIHHAQSLVSPPQTVVGLRLLDVPVPVIYGRSADENPFA